MRLRDQKGKYVPEQKNAYRIDGTVAYITLRSRKGEFLGEAVIDVEDFDRVMSLGHWHASWHTQTQQYKAQIKSGDRFISLHRFVSSAPTGTVVDHVNHRMLDCRKLNLRVVDGFTNQQNRRGANRNNRSSGARNVYWSEPSQKWHVRVGAHGRYHCIGTFKDLEEAKTAAEMARARLHS